MNEAAGEVFESTLLQIHELLRQDKDEEAERLQEDLNSWGAELSYAHRRMFSDLSADLYMIAGQEIRFSLESLGQPSTDPKDSFVAAFRNNDWHHMLCLLRSLELQMPEHRRAYIRYLAYSHYGRTQSALSFLDFACQLNDQSVGYRYLRLSDLVGSGNRERWMQFANDYVMNSSTDPSLKVLANSSLLRDLIVGRDEVATDRIVFLLDSLLYTAIPAFDQKVTPQPVQSLGYITAGYCAELLENSTLARRLYLAAVEVDPESSEAKDLLAPALHHNKLQSPLSDLNDSSAARCVDFFAATEAAAIYALS